MQASAATTEQAAAAAQQQAQMHQHMMRQQAQVAQAQQQAYYYSSLYQPPPPQRQTPAHYRGSRGRGGGGGGGGGGVTSSATSGGGGNSAGASVSGGISGAIATLEDSRPLSAGVTGDVDESGQRRGSDGGGHAATSLRSYTAPAISSDPSPAQDGGGGVGGGDADDSEENEVHGSSSRFPLHPSMLLRRISLPSAHAFGGGNFSPPSSRSGSSGLLARRHSLPPTIAPLPASGDVLGARADAGEALDSASSLAKRLGLVALSTL